MGSTQPSLDDAACRHSLWLGALARGRGRSGQCSDRRHWSGLDGTGIDGVISASAFATIVTTFDYRAHQLIVEDATTFPRKLGASRVGLVVRDDEGIATDVFARFEVGGKNYLCQVVTGSQPITFDTTLAPALGVNLNDPSLARVHTPWGDGVAATISSLTLDGASQTAMPHPQVAFANLIHDCYVGNAFWSRRGFTLDLPVEQCTFQGKPRARAIMAPAPLPERSRTACKRRRCSSAAPRSCEPQRRVRKSAPAPKSSRGTVVPPRDFLARRSLNAVNISCAYTSAHK